MKFYGASDVGLKRTNNQDSYALVENANACILAVICDGIGGGKAGDVASQIACDHLKNQFMTASSSTWKYLCISCITTYPSSFKNFITCRYAIPSILNGHCSV